jgi:hypothetical protein
MNEPRLCGYESTSGDAGLLRPDPGGSSPSGTGSVVFALSKLYYGDTDRNGFTAACEPWRQYGLNIDGKTTTTHSTDVCALNPGSALITQEDGENGIDNSFGENLLPILIALSGSTMSQKANATLLGGDETTLVRLDDLGSGSDYSPFPGLVYHAASTSMPPKWDGTDVRDVDIASLVSGSLSSPILMLSGYMNGRTWVGTQGGTMRFDLHVTAAGHPGPPLPVSHVQITMLVDPGNGTATSGVISGILAPDDAVAWAQNMEGWVSTSLCSGSAFQSIAQQILQASDIMMDGTNEPGEACNRISFGIGFDATAVTLGQVVSLPMAPDPCSDGGVEGGDE